MSVSLVILVLYVVALFLISWYAKKRSEGTTENFALAGRRLSAPLIAVSIIGLAIGGASTIGVSEQAFKVGLSAGWYTAAWGIGAIVMGFVMAKKYRDAGITTISELIERYHDKKAVILGVICQIVIQIVIISLQYIAGGSIISSLLPEISFTGGVIISALTFIGITFIGGMWSASLSNILNTVLIYGGIALAMVIQYIRVGGIQSLELKLPAGVPWMDITAGVGITGIITWIIVLVTVNLSLQSIVQISLGAKDAATARKGLVWGGIAMIPVGFMSALLGICAKATYPDMVAAMALPQIIMELQPVLSGITLAALWAADVSTACALLLSAGTLFSKDIYKRFIKTDATEQQQVMIMRVSIVFSGMVTVIMAMMVSGILNTIMIGLSLTAAFSVIVIVALFFPRYACKAAGFNTLLVGLLVLIIWQLVPQVRIFPHVIYPEWLICALTYGLTALFSPKTGSAV